MGQRTIGLTDYRANALTD